MPQSSIDPDALIDEARSANFLSLSERTLQAWRLKGSGPRFVKAGRAVRYRRRDLIAWIEANYAGGMLHSSASETAAP